LRSRIAVARNNFQIIIAIQRISIPRQTLIKDFN